MSRSRIEDAIVFGILVILTQAAISLPVKLAGTAVPGLGFVWLFGAFLCLVFAALDIKATLKAALYAWPILILTLFIWASNRWTTDHYVTLRGTVFITCSHLFVFALAARFTWERIIGLIAWTYIVLVGLSVFLVVALPYAGVMQDIHVGAWSGVWPEKQLLGMNACLGLIAALAMALLRPKHAQWWLLGAGMCLIAIIGSTGKTALLMTAMAMGIAILLRISNRGVVGALIAAWLGLVGAILGIALVTGGLDLLLKALGRSSDLTGRTEVWDAVMRIADMRPMTGWGYGAVWRDEAVMTSPYQWIMEWTDFKPSNAHSAWLDIYLQLGRPGVALLALCMGWAWFAVLFRPAQNYVATMFAGASLMAMTFISFTETNLVGSMDIHWLIVPLFGCKLFLEYRTPQSTQFQAFEELYNPPIKISRLS